MISTMFEQSAHPYLFLLGAEFERIKCLTRALQQVRTEGIIEPELQAVVLDMQHEVSQLRSAEIWRSLSDDFSLSDIDIEILICTLAVELDAGIGWHYEQLQAGTQKGPFLSLALLTELLYLTPEEVVLYRARLEVTAPLIAHGFITSTGDPFYGALRITPSFLKAFTENDFSLMAPVIPGASIVTGSGRFSDLIVSPMHEIVLDEFLLWAQKTVNATSETKEVSGPVALFSGPSGTGKSYAALCVANELGVPLYRVDLGVMISKYIGETEKNLNDLFSAAAHKKVLLLFDEADSLFGKRGEVRDARDRYANLEVSHLLSKMESHSGPCILTTNLRSNLDPAFARRFHMSISFSHPDVEARKRLWEKSVGPDLLCSDDLSFETVAKEIPLTGAQIKNASRHMHFCSGDVTTRRDLARAIYTELAKEGNEVPSSLLGSLKEEIQWFR